MNRRTRRIAGGVAALGAGAILIAPVAALAQSGEDPPATSTPAAADDTVAPPGSADDGTASHDRASRLTEILQPLVDAGTVTQAQLDAVVEALQAAGPVAGGGHGRGGDGPRGDWGGGRRVSLETAATTIGISAEDLRTAIADGQTLAEVATANGVEPQDVIDALVADATSRIDDAVTAGRITQADADGRLSNLTDRITTAVNDGFPARPDRKAGSDDATAPTEAPATTEGGG